MCTVSWVMDQYSEKWRNLVSPTPPWPDIPPLEIKTPPIPVLTKEEVEEFRTLIEKARKYDVEHNEPNCELEEKKETLKKLADQLGVKIDFL
jgi:hypothetical protein